MIGLILVNGTYKPPEELYVGGKAAEGSKNRREAEGRAVETLSEHLDLEHAIQPTSSDGIHDAFLFLPVYVAMDLLGTESALFVERTNWPRVIQRVSRISWW